LLLVAVSSEQTLAASPTTLAQLLDRAQIEDMIASYYSAGLNGNLGGPHRSFGSFFTADGKIDVNGTVAQGQKAIDALYATIPAEGGNWHMLYTNPTIVINGRTATVDVLWGSVGSATIKAKPLWDETGREHDDLVKRNGQWLIKFRWIQSDSGLSPTFSKYYKPR
jgi:hypothetical protein